MIIAVVPSPGHEALVAEGPPVDGCVPERPMTIDVLRPGSKHPCVDGCLMNLFRVPPLDLSGLKPGDECPACYDRGLVSVPALVLHAPGDPKLGMLRAREATYDGRSAAVGEEIRALRGGAGPIGQALHLSKPYFSWPLPEAPEWLGTPCPVLGDYSHPGRFAWALAHLLVQRGIAAEVIVLPADKAKE